MEFRTSNPTETFELGQITAAKFAPGDAICLTGDLGAGKTLLTQGMCIGLGVAEEVTSPTFTLLQIYEDGRIPVYHFDLYRLESPQELFDIGFDEYPRPDGVTIIEWADKFGSQMPDECLWIEMRLGRSEGQRLITFKPAGKRYEMLCEELRAVADTCFRHGHAGF